MLIQSLLYTKWAHRDSNPEPTDYESAALTVELWAQDLILSSGNGCKCTSQFNV